MKHGQHLKQPPREVNWPRVVDGGLKLFIYRGWSFLGEKKLMINDDVCDVAASMVMIDMI